MTAPLSGEPSPVAFGENRTSPAVVAILMQFLVSLTYSYSVFRTPLASAYGWSEAGTIAPYQCMLLMVALGSVLGGMWQDLKGPRVVATTGGILIAIGCLLASLVGSSLLLLVLTFGIIGGLGVGLVYVTPIANLIRWFPDKRGEVVGFAVMGSGCSALFWAPLLESLLGRDSRQYDSTIPRTFIIMAGIFLVVVVGLAQLYRVPPSDWRPVGWLPSTTDITRRNLSPRVMLRQREFYLLYVLFVFGTAVGQTTIGNAAPFLQSVRTPNASISIGFALGVLGICNAIGRLGWGTLSDRIGRGRVVILMECVSIVACLGFLRAPVGFVSVLIGLCLAVIAYSGFLAVMPALSADYFGSSHVGANYGLLFTAWGVSGFIAPGIFERVLDHAREAGNLAVGYNTVNIAFSLISLFVICLVFLLRPPQRS